MNLILGIGNENNGDDGIGPYISKNISTKNWIGINCGIIPENFYGKIVKYKPKKIIIIDAADMKLDPGEVRIIPKNKINQSSFSTHSMPLSLFIAHIKTLLKTDIKIVGIQPKQTNSKNISIEVLKSAETISNMILEDKINMIKEL